MGRKRNNTNSNSINHSDCNSSKNNSYSDSKGKEEDEEEKNTLFLCTSGIIRSLRKKLRLLSEWYTQYNSTEDAGSIHNTTVLRMQFLQSQKYISSLQA
ncbi:hypothetical protein RRG08_023281 [Elysia crispata]|uniref:Uncharacterized protein n=1 Tax=Elysia crispata TaxID=231223 RepID=A0AAE1BDJ7_9GAST|nr:hypothetical protein RRG08_023281 [Elysia crispata]